MTSPLFQQSNRLIVFTRYPEPGSTKTRLIPALGPERAAQLQTALTVRTLRIAKQYCTQHGCDLEVRFHGGDATRMGAMFGDDIRFFPQRDGSLGERLDDAVAASFSEGAERVLVIGSDCPGITSETLAAAIAGLSDANIVLGPAVDGGYYLIGLKANHSELFQEIDWGSDQVLHQTLARANKSKCKVRLLDTLSDVDYPEDLLACRVFDNDFQEVLPKTQEGLISIIVPTLNEQQNLENTLRPLAKLPDVETIVADGGSQDSTVQIAQSLATKVVASNPGRGRQMNTGAAFARGEFLLFLHADTQLPNAFQKHIRATLQGDCVAGAFGLHIDNAHWGFRWLETVIGWRSGLLQRPYGDQALFMKSESFYAMNGFPNWPLMEDYELCKRLRRIGRISITDATVTTSARRWLRHGILRTTAKNQMCVLGLAMGVSPERLSRFYRR